MADATGVAAFEQGSLDSGCLGRSAAQKPEFTKIPRFSVVIPVYNVEKYLPQCVKSVVEQPAPRDWECILVDDGSTDTSGAMCDAFAQACPGVRAVHQANAGLAAARNTGIAAAKGEWLLFLDSDDLWPADMLAHLRAQLAAHPGFDWYVARYRELDDATGQTAAPAEIAFVPGEFCSPDFAARVERLYGSAHWAVWKYCVRRQFLAQHGIAFCPEVIWAEDWPFDLELAHACQSLCFLDFVMTIYRANRAGSLMSAGLPRHFAGLAAAQRHLAVLFAGGGWSAAEQAEALRRAGNAFWPQARGAAVRDAAMRRACAPGVAQCRALYPCGEQGRGRADWTLFRLMLGWFGPRFALWAASLPKKSRAAGDP
jgi:hypothetical protein